MSKHKRAIIIGAGPAGLTAAYELLTKTDIKPVIFELTGDIGGISKTVNYKGNRIDIGGHRFFSKSRKVIDWWLKIIPLQGCPAADDLILKRAIPLSQNQKAPDPQKEEKVMLTRRRISRIFFLRKFFDYPLSINFRTIKNLGIVRLFRMGFSYIKVCLVPKREERNLEDFFINRFGQVLYRTFFKDYTEKVWGVPCKKISADWGHQRIRGLSITRALAHAVKKILFLSDTSLDQKKTVQSLIEQFLYPKHGPGQLWEEVAAIITQKGGKVYLNSQVVGVKYQQGVISGVEVRDTSTGQVAQVEGDYVISTMPLKDLIESLGEAVPEEVQKTASGLKYRDFITVGLLLKELKIKNETKIKTINDIVPDNWIYMQERDVKLGRIQVFNNWSPYMVADPNTVWLGLEYFCNEGDQLWQKSDEEFNQLAVDELSHIGFIDKSQVLDFIVVRMKKTYPTYCGSYDQFPLIRNFTDSIPNLFLIGRMGMHRYNNMDHSMLTAMEAVENIVKGNPQKENIWSINI